MTGYIGIGGTAKKIKNIYIGVGGVAKKVKKAYIGVGGVAKQWYSSTPSLADLFSNAVRIGGAGRWNASTNLQVSLTGIDTSTPYYCFLSVGDNYEISKFVGSTKTVLASDNGHYVSLSSNKLISTSYSGTIELLRFPSYTNIADTLLSSITVTVNNYRYGSTKKNLQADRSDDFPSSYKLYAIVFVDNSTDYISVSDGASFMGGDIPAPLFSHPDNRTYMCKPSSTTYSVSTDGTNEGTYNIAVIYELEMPN